MTKIIIGIAVSVALSGIGRAENPSGKKPPPAEALSLSKELKARCLEVLRQALKLEEFRPGIHAAEAMTLAGQGQEVRQSFTKALEKETDDLKRCGLARELVCAGDRSKAEVLLELLAKPDLNVQVHAAESLFKVGEVGDGNLLRKAMGQDGKVSLQLMAAGALADKDKKAALAVIRPRLEGEDADGQMLAAWLLAKLGDKSDMPRLRRLVRADKNKQVKVYAAHALAVLGDADGKAALAKNLDASEADTRAFAAEFAGHARMSSVAEKLTKLLDDSATDVRVRAAQSLLELSKKPE